MDPLTRVAAVVVLAEMLLLRGATRVFIHIPGLDVTTGLIGRVTEVARLTFRMAVPLTFALLVTLIATSWSRSSRRAMAVLVSAFAATAAIGLVEALAPEADVVMLVLVTAVAALALADLDSRSKIVIAAWSAAFVLAGVSQLLDQWAANGTMSASAPRFAGLGQAIALGAFLAAPVMLGRRLRRSDWLVYLGVVALITPAFLGAERQAATKILLLWNLGWSSAYPMILYILAIGSLVMTMVALVREDRSTDAAALVFLGAAGFGLFSSYQTALFVVGLVLISASTRVGSPSAVEPAMT